MKKTMALFFCFMIMLTVGCEKGASVSESQSQSGSGQNTETLFSTENIEYTDKNGDAKYKIVRPSDGSLNESEAAGYIFKQMKEKTGVKLKNISDESGEWEFEILIGNTNRAESAKALQYLKSVSGGRVDDYIICTLNGKIVINALSSEALTAAAKRFISEYAVAEGVVGGIKCINLTDGDYTDVSVNGVKLGYFGIVVQSTNRSYLVQTELEKAVNGIVEKTGYLLRITEDIGETENEYEITVGNCEREGVERLGDKDTYSVKISGKKIFLNGGSTYATAMAVSEFFGQCISGKAFTDSDSFVGSYGQAAENYDKSNYYTPVWTEDFDTPSDKHETGVDTDKWAFVSDTYTAKHGRTAVRTESASRIYVADGMLNFTASFDDEYYYGFKLTTKNKMTFKYGILEMSAILPHGEPFWISLWANSVDPTDSATFMTEVNVVEMFGNSTYEASNLHGWLKTQKRDVYESYWKNIGVEEHWSLDADYSSQKRYTLPNGQKFNDGFHTFSYIWSDSQCAFACDGNMYFTIDPRENELWSETFNQPIYLILSEIVGSLDAVGEVGDDDPAWYETNNFNIDYVHIYQKNDGISELNFG